MVYGEEQKKEIETIKPRSIELKLSDADVMRIWQKAGSVGLSVSELLEKFIGDLVSGTYSNGSDERDLAEEWFDRCDFGMFPEETFLRYLIEEENVEDVIGYWEDIKSYKQDLEESNTDKDKYAEEEIEAAKEELSYCEKVLNETFAGYKDWAEGDTTGTLEEEMEKVLNWYKDMENMKYVLDKQNQSSPVEEKKDK